MPNWCNNSMTVSGPGAASFYDAITSHPEFENQTESWAAPLIYAIIPAPTDVMRALWVVAEVARYNEKNSEVTCCNEDDYLAQFFPNNCRAFDLRVSEFEEEDSSFQMSFDTAWGPIDEIFDLIRKNHPTCSFVATYYEPGMAFAGKYSFSFDSDSFFGDGFSHESYSESEDGEEYAKFLIEEGYEPEKTFYDDKGTYVGYHYDEEEEEK